MPVERLLSEVRLRDVMSAPAISVGLDTEVEEAARVMAEEKLGPPPVVDRGRIVGIAKGGVDIRCAITVSLRGRRRLHVEDVATTPRQALDEALAKLERCVLRTEEFDRDSRRRPKKYYAATRLAGRRV